MIRHLYKKAAVIIAQTEEMKQGLVTKAGLSENNVIVLQKPLDEGRIKESLKNSANPFPNNGNKHFVASDRFAEAKGFDILITAFSKIKERNKNVDLTILGGSYSEINPALDKVYELISVYRLEQSVTLAGFQSNPYPYIKYADFFVLSSRHEGLPNVLIETLYLNTPVAATKCIPVVSRIVDEGKNDFLSDVESPESLALAMERAVSLGQVCSTTNFSVGKSEPLNMVMARIDELYTKDPTSGQRKLQSNLKKFYGIEVGRRLIRHFMEIMQIAAIYPKPNLSMPNTMNKKFPYLLRNVAITHVNQV